MITLSIPSPNQSFIELGPLTIHFYALSIIAGVVAAVYLGNRRYLGCGGAPGVVSDVALFAVPAGVIGGRLYHVLTSPDQYFGKDGNPAAVFAIWKGGLGIWGAISLGAVAAYFAYRSHKRNQGISFRIFADCLAPGLLVAQAIGRFGNWFNKELFGRPLEAPWALEIPLIYRPVGYRNFETFHPTFLYEAIWSLSVAVFLIHWPRIRALAPGSIFALYALLYSLGRGFIETLRIDSSELIAGLRLNLWTSALVIIIASSVLYLLNRSKPSR